MLATIKTTSLMIMALLAAMGNTAPGALDARQVPTSVLDFTLYQTAPPNEGACFDPVGQPRHLPPANLTIPNPEGGRLTPCTNENFTAVQINAQHPPIHCSFIAYESNNCPDLSIGFIGVWDDLTCHAGRRDGAVVQLRSWRVACTGV